MRPSPEGPQLNPNRKSVLFCPECGHESLVDGDWLINEKACAMDWKCPECRTIIDSRSRFDENEPDRISPEHPPQDWNIPAGVYVATLTLFEQLWLDLWKSQLRLLSE